MGMYTSAIMELWLDLPPDALAWLRWVTVEESLGGWDQWDDLEPARPEHPFFQCSRVTALFRGVSAYHPELHQPDDGTGDAFERWGRRPRFAQCPDGTWVLQTMASLKNYDNEIQLFGDWIDPYVLCGHICSRYEEVTTYSVRAWTFDLRRTSGPPTP